MPEVSLQKQYIDTDHCRLVQGGYMLYLIREGNCENGICDSET